MDQEKKTRREEPNHWTDGWTDGRAVDRGPITDPSQRRSSERAGDADVHTQLSNLIIQRVVLMGQTVEREVGSE